MTARRRTSFTALGDINQFVGPRALTLTRAQNLCADFFQLMVIYTVFPSRREVGGTAESLCSGTAAIPPCCPRSSQRSWPFTEASTDADRVIDSVSECISSFVDLVDEVVRCGGHIHYGSGTTTNAVLRPERGPTLPDAAATCHPKCWSEGNGFALGKKAFGDLLWRVCPLQK